MKIDELNGIHSLPVPSINEREECGWCKKKLAIAVVRENDHAQFERRNYSIPFKRGKVIKWQYRSHGHFCTNLCCEMYANKAYDMLKK